MSDPQKPIVEDVVSNDAILPKAESSLPMLRSEQLFNGQREILIAHCDEIYRLRLTRNGKLILTK